MEMIHVTVAGRSAGRYGLEPAADASRRECTIPQSAADAGEMEISLPFADASAGDDGEYVIPSVQTCFLTSFRPRGDLTHTEKSLPLPIAGCRKGKTAFLIVMEGMKWDVQLRIRVTDGQYRLSLVYDLDEISLYEEIRFSVYTLEGEEADYSGMARLYRRLQAKRLGLIPLAKRAETEPLIREACGVMPIVRIRMGWKPVPSPVPEQTLDTEPPMHAACTFRQVIRLMDEMKAQGIGHAEICLVGWNVRGHDGRWPQAFPAEEALGGEEGLCEAAAHAKAIGYRLVCHTNTSDAYRIADCWDEEEIIRRKDGSLHQNSEGWSGGNMYRLCPEPALRRHTLPTLDRLKELGMHGFHYIDVIGTVQPRTCFHPAHPVNASGCAERWNAMLDEARARMGGAASEGGFDFAAGHLDFALYTAFRILDGRAGIADERIPLWQLVYHGYILSNASAETVNTMVKPAVHRLKAYEFGSVPAVYYYSRFVGGERSNWMGESDMRCSTEEELRDSVRRLKAELDAYAPFAPRQLAFMDSHRKLSDGVYETVYSDGWRTVADYNTNEIRLIQPE